MTCLSTECILFNNDMAHTYVRALTGMGVGPARLSMGCGHG